MTSTAASEEAGRPHGPVRAGIRITTLDSIRGFAVLGILGMNAVSYGLVPGAYFNLAAGGSSSKLDWAIGGFGEIFIDQKFMALFSMLFGAGIVLFAERAEMKGRRPALFSLWRNALLFGIGALHSLLWEGDVLVVYAMASPLLIALRKRRPGALLVIGTICFLLSPFAAWMTQLSVDASGRGLGEIWFATGEVSDEIGLFVLFDFFCRALGMMLIGVALYRMGIVTGHRSQALYRRFAWVGLGVGLPFAAAGLFYVAANDFSPTIALVGGIPNTLATIPVTLGYLGAIVLWSREGEGPLRERIRAVGRMALTNYLSQTLLGIAFFHGLLGRDDLSRTEIGLFVPSVWAVQLYWSKAWLDRFQFGPVEWLWRCATYLEIQTLRRIDRDSA